MNQPDPIRPRSRVIPIDSPEGQRRLKQQREADERRKKEQVAIADLPPFASLREMDMDLQAVRAGAAMAAEGTTRATATEVARYCEEHLDFVMGATDVGVAFSRYDIRSVTSHGKSRFVLDLQQLRSIGEALATRLEESRPAVEQTLERLGDISEQVGELQERVERTAGLYERGLWLEEQLASARGLSNRVQDLERRFEEVKRQSKHADDLQAWIDSKDEQLKDLAKLQKRAKDIEARLKGAEEKRKELEATEDSLRRDEAQLSQRETTLGRKLADVQRRTQNASLAEIEEAIAEGQKELDQVQKQLGEKRGLLSRMLGGGQGS